MMPRSGYLWGPSCWKDAEWRDMTSLEMVSWLAGQQGSHMFAGDLTPLIILLPQHAEGL